MTVKSQGCRKNKKELSEEGRWCGHGLGLSEEQQGPV